MSAAFWARLLCCGCAGRRKPEPNISSPFGADWDYRAPSTPARSHRTQPSDTSADSYGSADSRTPFAHAPRPAPPPPPPPKDVLPSSRWSPQSEVPEPGSLPQRLRHSTSKVAMYLKHKLSLQHFSPPALD